MKHYDLIEEFKEINSGSTKESIISKLDQEESFILEQLRATREKRYLIEILTLIENINNVLSKLPLETIKDINLSLYIGKDIKRNHTWDYTRLTSALTVGFIDDKKNSVTVFDKIYLQEINNLLNESDFVYGLSGLKDERQQFIIPLTEIKESLISHLLSKEVINKIEHDRLEASLHRNDEVINRKMKI